jgi:hypothetical protein
MNFAFNGSALRVDTTCPPDAGCDGRLKVYIEGSDPITLTADSGAHWVARWLPVGTREVTIEVLDGRAGVAALTVGRELPIALLWVALGVLAAAALIIALAQVVRAIRRRRQPEYAPVPPPPSDGPPVYPRRRLWRGVKE